MALAFDGLLFLHMFTVIHNKSAHQIYCKKFYSIIGNGEIVLQVTG